MSISKYPKDWSTPITVIKDNKHLVSGHYSCEETTTSDYPQYLPYVLNLTEKFQPACTSLTIQQNEEYSIEINAYKNEQLVIQTTLRANKDYVIKDGWVILKGIGEGGINRGGVLGFSIEKTSFSQNSSGDLIFKNYEGVVAIYFLFPVIAVMRSWLKFEKTTFNNSKGGR